MDKTKETFVEDLSVWRDYFKSHALPGYVRLRPRPGVRDPASIVAGSYANDLEQGTS